MARGVDDVKAVPGKTGAARRAAPAQGHDAVRYRAALRRFCLSSASKMAAAIRGPMSKQPSGNGVQRRRCGASTSGRNGIERRTGYAVGGRRLRRACERTIDPARVH